MRPDRFEQKIRRKEEMREDRFSGNDVLYMFFLGLATSAHVLLMVYIGMNSDILLNIPIGLIFVAWGALALGHFALVIAAKPAMEKICPLWASLMQWVPVVIPALAVLAEYLS